MFTKKQKITEKVTFKVTDNAISCITLVLQSGKYSVKNYQDIPLEKGIISKAEILKPEALASILRDFSSQMSNKNVNILLPHGLFLCSEGILSSQDKDKPLRSRVKEYFKKNTKKEKWHATHVCEFSDYVVKDTQAILFRCVEKDIYKSYIHVWEKAGLSVSSINSTVLAFDHVLPKERSTFIYIDHTHTRVVDFKDGLYISSKSFEFSYNQLVKDIVKNVSIDEKEAKKILSRYGLLRAHKDEKVYKNLLRSVSPLLDFLKRRKVKESVGVTVVFADTPLLGFMDILKKSISTEVKELDILQKEKYPFQEVLTLHKKDSYKYQAHIAESLRSFSR